MARTSRKLNKTATIISIVFVIFALCIAGGLIFFASSFGNIEQEKYDLTAGSTVYDEYDSPVILSENGYIISSWQGGRLAKTNNGTSINLAENTIAVDNQKIVVIGGGYRIYEDGTAIQLDDLYETSISDYQFYKLADRKYLFVSPSIVDENNTLNTYGYCYIVMDKQGNAKIMNDNMYSKTLIPTVIQGGDMTFDIANELFYFNTMEIDMKDVMGTTNEYNPLLYVDANSGYDGYNFVNPETIELEIKGGDGGTGGIGGQGGRGGTGGTGGNGSNAEQSDIVKQITLLGVDKTSTSLTISYHAVDPFAQYGLIYLAVYDDSVDLSKPSERKGYLGTHMYGVNVYNNSLTVYDLEPDTTYQVVIGHATGDDDTWYIDDMIRTTTNSTTNKISIKSQTANNLKLSVKFDKYYDFYKYGKIDVYYYSPSSNDASCRLSRSTLNPISTSFSVLDATSENGVIIDIGYDLDIAQKSEIFDFEIQLNETSEFKKDEGIKQTISVRNGYYDGTVCGTTYFVTVSDGFDGQISKTAYKPEASFTFPPSLNPTTLFNQSAYNYGWGLTFKGWMYSGDPLPASASDPVTVRASNSTVKIDKDSEVKAVWECPEHCHLGDHQCVPDDGYKIDPTNPNTAIKITD